jgi:hypothetical protein
MDDHIAEWSLAELVEDPLIGLVMKSACVDRRRVECLFERITRARTRGDQALRLRLGDKETQRCTIC